jgi:SAM-dependent methyltransferase
VISPTERFSDRVADYVRARPTYPGEVIELLIQECGIDADSFVADIGCGTGIFAQQLLSIGCLVVGVEPNEPMREAAVANLSSYSNFLATDASGEQTGLADKSVDLISVAQAFHWLDQAKAHEEFLRILKPRGWVALIWNERKMSGSGFLDGYERTLKECAPEYAFVRHRNNVDEEILAWFQNPAASVHIFENSQKIELDSLLSRAFSSSYVPADGTEGRNKVRQALTNLFNETQSNGLVSFEYETKVFLGQLG